MRNVCGVGAGRAVVSPMAAPTASFAELPNGTKADFAVRGGGVPAAGFGGRVGSGFRSGAFADNGFRSGGFHHGFHHGRRFAYGAFGVGLGYGPYAYYGDYDYPYYAYDYPYYGYDGSYYDDSYYGDGGCYVVRRRVHTRYGWRIRPVQVCG